MPATATRAIIAAMQLRPLTAIVILALLAACGNDAKPEATADPAVTATTAQSDTVGETTSSAETSAAAPQPQGSATAAPSAESGQDNKALAGNTAPRTGDGASSTASADGTAEPVAAATSSAAAAPEPAGKTFGDKAVESMYAAWLQSAGRYTVGQPASVQAVVVAKGEYKCNDNYPYKFKLNAAPAGVSFPDTVARAVTKGKARSVVSVPFTPTSAGNKTISGTFYFSVCNDSTCKIAKQSLSVTIAVNDG